MKTKSEWRFYFKKRLRDDGDFGLSELKQLNQNVMKVLSHESGVWGGFRPHQMEPDLTNAIQGSAHLSWVFPVVENNQLQWWRPGSKGFQIGAFGIEEPITSGTNGAEQVDPRKISGLLIPGLGFDKRGVRLGRGQGYFDRFLSGWSGKKIGVAFSYQVVEELPCEAHDIRMDMVITGQNRVVTGLKRS